MESETVEPKKKKGNLFTFLIVNSFILVFFLGCAGIFFPIQFLFNTFLGWFVFLKRVIPQVTVPVSGLVTALVVVAIMALLIQLLGRVLWRHLQHLNSITASDQWKWRWTFALIAFLVISFAGGIAAVGMVRQTVWMAISEKILDVEITAESAKRSISKNNLKQIGLALYNYHEVTHVLPGGGFFNGAGEPQHGWVAQLLPYMDQQALYQTIDFHQPWTADINREPFQTELPFLLNPGIRQLEQPTDYQPADYAANNQIFNVNTSMKLSDIKDGLAYTLLAGEVSTGIKAWGDPTNFRDPKLGINANPQGFGSPFIGGANFLLGDGSVRFISENIDPRTLKALATPNGGDIVNQD